MSYRVFIGLWFEGDDEPDWVHFDVTGFTWQAAKELLAKRLKQYESDECEHCREQAKKEYDRLMGAESGDFKAEVDGEDYLIIEEV